MESILQEFHVLQRPINNKIKFKYDQTKSQSRPRKKQNHSNIKLPFINFENRQKNREVIPIQNSAKIINAISRSLTFQHKKLTCLNADSLKKINQQTKSLPYNSIVYQNQIKDLNQIFSGVGFHLKAKDVIVLQGKNSETTFTFFTNYPQHPLSICCNSCVVIKHFHFVTPLYQRSSHLLSRQNQKPLKNMIIISCFLCQSQLIKIRKQTENQLLQPVLSEFQQKKRLLNYSKLISSGKFKKHFIRDSDRDDSSSFLNQSRTKSILHHNQSIFLNKKQQSEGKMHLHLPYVEKIQDREKINTQQRSLDLIKLTNKSKLHQRLNYVQGKISGTERYSENRQFCQN